MSEIDEIISVTVQVEDTGVAREGFGLAMVLSHNATFPERIRYYDDQAGVLGDWASDSPEAVQTGILFSQQPHPPQVAIGRATTSITMKYALAAQEVAANHVYSLDVAGQGVTPTNVLYKTGTSFSLDLSTKTTHLNTVVEAISQTIAPSLVISGGAGTKAGTISESGTTTTITLDTTVSQVSDLEALFASSTLMRVRSPGTQANTFVTGSDAFTITPLAVATVSNDEIMSNLNAKLNAVAGKNYTSSLQGAAGSQTIQVLGTAPGNYFSVSVEDALSLKNAMTHTGDPSADLAAIDLASTANPFYALLTIYNAQAYVLAAAAYCEANDKIYICDVPETDVLNATSTGNADTMDKLKGHGYTRTLGNYHPVPNEALSSALTGRLIALNPGLWTAAFKSLIGPSPIAINATQRTNLKAKRCNYYTTRKGRAVTLYGMVGSTVYGFLDTVVGLDYFLDDVQSSAFGVFAGTDKVAYDDADIAQIASAIRGAISRAMGDDHKIISRGTPGNLTDPIPSIEFPAVADIDPSIRSLREVPDGVLTCRLLGAAQSVAMRAVITF